MNLKDYSNLNYLWAALMVEELVRNGIDYFCIAPGSRSAPLAMAVAAHKQANANSFVHFDERGLAFHALGYVAASKRPCVIITTSGTAVANLLPAVIEASKKKLPLIILTADRPPELRLTGAHQTIDQVNIFGQYARWQCDLPCPTADIPPEYVLTTIDQAVARAKSGELRGSVHINCMYREPLALIQPTLVEFNLQYFQSIKKWLKTADVYTRYVHSQKEINDEDVRHVILRIQTIKSGIIVVGKLAGFKEQQAVIQLAEKLNWPIFPDISSGLRLGNPHAHVIHYFDQILKSKKMKVDGVLHLGGRITSKRWYQYVEAVKPQEYIMVLNHPLRNDPLHNVSLRVQSEIASFCNAIQKKVPQRKTSSLLSILRKINTTENQKITKIFKKSKYLTESAVARVITQNIPEDTGLFLASSMSVREVDMFGVSDGAPCVIGSNRGASGIDGTVASAVGFLKGLKKPTTLLIGDLALLHDLNSLAMLKDLLYPLIVIVLNNNGGNIFSLLPIAKHTKPQVFIKYFTTPHHRQFHGAAEIFDLDYTHLETLEEFEKTYHIALKSTVSMMIEI